MTEQGSWPYERHDSEAGRSAHTGSVPPTGDPSLELFGHGWTPGQEAVASIEEYTGRHRAPDGIG